MAIQGSSIICGGSSGALFFWDISGASIAPAVAMSPHQSPINCITVSPDGKTLVTGDDSGCVAIFRRNATHE